MRRYPALACGIRAISELDRRLPKWRQTGHLTDCGFSRGKDPGFDCYDGKSFESRPLKSRPAGLQACRHLVAEGADIFRIGLHERKVCYGERKGADSRIQ